MNAAIFVSFNRKIADRIAPLIARTPVTPNQITLLACCCGIVAACAMSYGNRMGMIISALFLHVSFILDNCDGQVARIKSMSSSFGMWWDYIADLIVDMSLWTGSAVGAYRIYPSKLWIFPLLLAVIGSLLNFWRVVSMRSRSPKPSTVVAVPAEKGMIAALLDDGDPSVLVWILGIIGSPVVFLVLGCTYINALVILGICEKKN